MPSPRTNVAHPLDSFYFALNDAVLECSLLPRVPKGDAMASQESVTALLVRAQQGDRSAFDALFPIVYEELHRLAKAQRHRWRGNYTINTTALLHEAYLKLVQQERVNVREKRHFFVLAAKVMRHILVGYARRQQAIKRGGHVEKVSLDEADDALIRLVPPESADELVALDEALKLLERVNERQARVVECRFFAGLAVTETAEVLGISAATVKRDWRFARATLRHAIRPHLLDQVKPRRDA